MGLISGLSRLDARIGRRITKFMHATNPTYLRKLLYRPIRVNGGKVTPKLISHLKEYGVGEDVIKNLQEMPEGTSAIVQLPSALALPSRAALIGVPVAGATYITNVGDIRGNLKRQQQYVAQANNYLKRYSGALQNRYGTVTSALRNNLTKTKTNVR